MSIGEVRWLELARSFIGIHEIPGPKHNAAILEMARDAHLEWITDDETAWCAVFAAAMLERAQVRSPRSAAARSFLNWGLDVENLGRERIPLGAVVVYERGPDHGHVGFAVGLTDAGEIMTLGGNQGNAVSILPFKRERLLGARWPIECKNDIRMLLDLPRLASTAPASTNEA